MKNSPTENNSIPALKRNLIKIAGVISQLDKTTAKQRRTEMANKQIDVISLNTLLKPWHMKYHKGQKMYYLADITLPPDVYDLFDDAGFELSNPDEPAFFYGIPAENEAFINMLREKFGNSIAIFSSDDL